MLVHIPIVVYISPSFYPDYKERYYILFCIHCSCMNDRPCREDSLIIHTILITVTISVIRSQGT
jgi:hypothetical protein